MADSPVTRELRTLPVTGGPAVAGIFPALEEMLTDRGPALLPVPADEPIRLDVDLVPTDAVLQPGHRLRVDVYAASLPRYLTLVPDLIKARGRRHQRLVLDPDHPSHLTLLAGDGLR